MASILYAVILWSVSFYSALAAESQNNVDTSDWTLLSIQSDIRIGYFHTALYELHANGLCHNGGVEEVHLVCGNAYRGLGAYADAIASYEKALAINPLSASAFYGRASAFALIGNYEKAISDIDESLRIDQRIFAISGGGKRKQDDLSIRGYSKIYRGDFRGALLDFLESKELEPLLSTYHLLWIHLIRVHLGDDDALEFGETSRRAVKGDPRAAEERIGPRLGGWPRPIFELFLGRIDETTLQKLARTPTPERRHSGNATKDLSRALEADYKDEKNVKICEANFWLGVYRIQKHQDKKAMPLFADAVRGCPSYVVEGHAAAAELKELNR